MSKEPVGRLGKGAIATGATEAGIARDLTGHNPSIVLIATSAIEGRVLGNHPVRDRRCL